MLSVVESLREFWPWLSGTLIPVSVITDHKNLEYFMVSCQLNCCQACWSLDLAEYNFKLTWAPSTKNPADPSSWCPDYIPQEGDPTKNLNFLSLLKDSHVDWLCDKSNPFPLSSSISLYSAALFTIDTMTITQEFKSTLSSDPSWHVSLDQESSDPSKHIKLWSKLNDIIFYHDRIYVPPLFIQKFYSLSWFPSIRSPRSSKNNRTSLSRLLLAWLIKGHLPLCVQLWSVPM